MDDVMFQASEPIFPVSDVVETVRYYREVLGFREGWTWGEPPDVGGVRWGEFGAMFSRVSAQDDRIGGQWNTYFVEGIDSLLEFHSRNGASILSPLEAKPWGLLEYTVRDLNGHCLRFCQRGSHRSKSSERETAADVAIVERLATPEEHHRIHCAVGWTRDDGIEGTAASLSGARFGVVAMAGEEVVGTGMVLGDGRTFAYLKDIMVLPEWQGRGIGTRIVAALMAVLRRSEPGDMLVTLFTGKNLSEFYERAGFVGPERLYGMSLSIAGRSGAAKEDR